MKIRFFAHRLLVLTSCAALLLPSIVFFANAQEIRERVVIHVGAPAVWSMGQAHYLLSKMHRDNRKLNTRMPNDDALDANAINATRIQILKTLLDVQAQFDQKLGVENRAKLAEHERKLADRTAARNELVNVTAQLQVLDGETANLKKDLARKEVELEQKKSASLPNRGGASEEIKQLEQEIAVLKKDIETKEKQRSELAAKKTALETAATKDIDVSGLANVDLSSGIASLPGFSELGSFLKEAVGKVDLPRLAATTVLDNFIGMQYEIIAKQLTLLRDEVGRDNRIIFLELPASIYTVADKGDDYVAQVQWKVSQSAEVTEDEENEAFGYKKTDNKTHGHKKTDYASKLSVKRNDNKENEDKEDNDDLKWNPVDSNDIRALDIIPHQSSLNINDVQATTRQKNFLGVLKLLVGFGLKVNYQRQSELYEQFLRQETFAAGFGKGLNTFGWTFGPEPGRKRILPGVRTMYAVLIVPQKTVALQLEACGIAYHREKVPDYSNSKQVVAPTQTFNVLVPNLATSAWYTNYVNYTTANAGEPVTVVLRGEGFSSQTGVLVDGTALRSVHSVGNTVVSNAEEDAAAIKGVHGQFEVVNSRQIVMKFSMDNPNYIGTPTITLISPEKSAALNFYTMTEINSKPRTSLYEFSLLGPMFVEKFNLNEKLHVIDDDISVDTRKFVKARLKGEGLRRGADVWINNRRVDYEYSCEFGNLEKCLSNKCDQEFVVQTDTKEYFLYFQKPPASAKEWEIRYRQQTVRGFEIAEFSHLAVPPSKAGKVDIVSYTPNSLQNTATLELKFFGKPIDAELIPQAVGTLIPQKMEISPLQDDKKKLSCPEGFRLEKDKCHGQAKFYQESTNDDIWRALFRVNYEDNGITRVERDAVSVRVKLNNAGKTEEVLKTTELILPVRPQVTNILITPAPIPDELGSVITISGINLQNVVKVFVADHEAKIVTPPDNYSLTVRLAKGTFIKEEKGVKVPVTLVTKDGQSVSGIVTVGSDPADHNPSKTKKQGTKATKQE